MLKYIIRLDDACPEMDEKKWQKIEELLDKYEIKPIVGIIPDNKSEEFIYPKIDDFWNKYAKKWQKKGWIIAQHGFNHSLNKDIRTEFKGKKYKEQEEILNKGYKKLVSQGIYPTCFFAPAHTFDKNTIKACRNLNYYKFISDGFAYFPYKKDGMIFMPSVFDTPHKISKKGVFTFVFHPNNISDKSLIYLEKFILSHKKEFKVNINEILDKYGHRNRNFKDILLSFLIYSYRMLRNIKKGNKGLDVGGN